MTKPPSARDGKPIGTPMQLHHAARAGVTGDRPAVDLRSKAFRACSPGLKRAIQERMQSRPWELTRRQRKEKSWLDTLAARPRESTPRLVKRR